MSGHGILLLTESSGWGGGLSEYIVVKDSMLYHLPDNVSFELGGKIPALQK